MRWSNWLEMASVCAGVAAGPLLAGCAAEDQPSPGVLVVPFELGNQRSCEDLGIVAVRGELDDGDFVEETDCESGELRFEHLMPGRYGVVLYGLDDNDVPVMDSLKTGPQMISVVGEGTTVVFDPALALTAAPAFVDLRWAFGFGSCDSTSITGFDVTAWRSDGSALLMQSEIACDVAGKGRDQYRRVSDPERELTGDVVGEIEVQPHDRDGRPVGEPITFTFEPPGPGESLRLSLSCDAGGCEGSGAPD